MSVLPYLSAQVAFHPPVNAKLYISSISSFIDSQQAAYHPCAISLGDIKRIDHQLQLATVGNFQSSLIPPYSTQLLCAADLLVSVLLRSSTTLSMSSQFQNESLSLIRYAQEISNKFRSLPIYDRLRFQTYAAQASNYTRKKLWPRARDQIDKTMQFIYNEQNPLFPSTQATIVKCIL
ncbi:MAG: hypothetical protein EZS28_007914 [Streblomastix strix]|uniref:Uncharacterized protein n=1 Tax=Streblomastix strix TaxID=222440 RepID=A0A5J4WPL5_9EUKA|nr:MAG: hypothetical protein EZS28_026590 [Streblomastix strix]KAA6396562.1 MAG: hypothetical protein EZS28_007914 [Streblomastix strix]